MVNTVWCWLSSYIFPFSYHLIKGIREKMINKSYYLMVNLIRDHSQPESVILKHLQCFRHPHIRSSFIHAVTAVVYLEGFKHFLYHSLICVIGHSTLNQHSNSISYEASYFLQRPYRHAIICKGIVHAVCKVI